MKTQLYFWKPLIKRHKIELSIVGDYFNRTKSHFENIHEEANDYSKKLFSEYSWTEDTDEAAVAEWAEEESIIMYQSLLTMKSNHLLMSISLLYHTWEQQLIKFTIKELSHDLEWTKKGMQFGEVQKIFDLHDVSISKTKSWVKLRELKFLTNTIKHADGDSAEKLRKIRPDFFKSTLIDTHFDTLDLNGAVLLDGYTLKVHERDFNEYIEAVKGFWDEMPERAFADVDLIIAAFDK
ncbi:hypothetical protein AB4Z17_29380 [Paenibacillus sp. TAF43_2]|uniref:hypothetical protein n=1 Tax=Paenibacillus sp. TAF43_2 TaxID=3233069 RepID=UPI003F98AB5E